MRFVLILIVMAVAPTVSSFASEQPDSVWLERKVFQMSSLREKQKDRPEKHSEKAEKEKKSETSHEDKSDKKKKKRRSPMSRPATFFIRSGEFPLASDDNYELLNSHCWLKMPDQSFKKVIPKKTEAGISISDKALQAGLYRLHFYNDMGVIDQVRYHFYSINWFRNAGEDDFEIRPSAEEPRNGFIGEEPIFFLEDLTPDVENNYVARKRYTGDTFPVRILFRGKPVVGASVSLTTVKGWSKTVLSDSEGKAEFLLIKEIFHNDKVYKDPEPYLIKAVYEVDSAGSFQGRPYNKEVYTATSRLMIYPTPYDWKSKSAGFYIFAGTTLTIMMAAAIRRKRINTL